MRETYSQSGDPRRPLIGPGMPEDSAERLMDEARQRVRESEDESREGARTARRLMGAFALSAVLTVMSFVFLPKWGVHLPPMIPALGFVLILVGVLLSSHDGARERKRVVCEREDEGCPTCCGGPRPLRVFREE